MTMRAKILVASSVLACGSAQAAEKLLDGAYGNAAGCIYARTGQSSAADVLLLLNDEGVTTSETRCRFHGKATSRKNGFSHQIQCRSEEETGAVETVDLLRSPNGYTVRFNDGITWGPLPKCH